MIVKIYSCQDWDTTTITFAPQPLGKIESLYDPHCLGYQGDKFEAKIRAAEEEFDLVYFDYPAA